MPYLGPAPVVGRYLVVDDISSGFNGNEVNFNLTESTVAVKPGAAPNLLLSLGGVIQKPGTDFTISGSTLTFTTAPVAGTTFFATVLGDAYAVGTPSNGTITPASIASSGNFSFPGNLTANGAMYVNGGTINTLLTLTSTDANSSIKLVDNSSYGFVSYGSTDTLGLLLSSDAGNEVADSIIRFKIDNAEKVRIKADGNVGIGATSPLGKLHVKTGNSGGSVGTSADEFVLENSDNTGMTILSGTTNEGAINFADADDVNPGRVVYMHDGNYMRFHTNDTEKVRITSAGNVGIGTISPDQILHIESGSAVAKMVTTTGGNSARLIIKAPVDSYSGLHFGDPDDEDIGRIRYYHSNNSMRFTSNTTEAMRINSDGELLIGTTSAITNCKLIVQGSGTTLLRVANSDDGTAGISLVNTGSSNWAITNTNSVLKFDVAGTERASIQYNGQMLMGTGAVESDFAITNRNQPRGMYTEVASIPNDTNILAVEMKSTQDSKQRAVKLGLRKANNENASGFLYLHQRDGGHSYIYTDDSNVVRVSNLVSNVGAASGTVVGSQTSDIRLKNNLGNVGYGLTEINAINPIKFTMKKDTTRQRIGFSAQDVKTIIPEAVYDTKDIVEIDGSNVEDILAMEYVALIPVLVNAVKELSAKVTALESA